MKVIIYYILPLQLETLFYGDNPVDEWEDVQVEKGVPAELSGELRHNGHVAFILSHSSMQSAWK